jgi:cell division protein FtsZ
MLSRRNFMKGLFGSGIFLGSGSINPFQPSLSWQLGEAINKKDFQARKIQVLGLGWCGNNVIDYMIRSKMTGVEFIAANTDLKALSSSLADKRILLGADVTRGLGSGANPELGREATLETRREIRAALRGSDILFIVAGMGGGTGTGGAPVIAKISKELGIPTLAIITKPFYFEGDERLRQAETGIEALRKETNVLIFIPNDRIYLHYKTKYLDVLKQSDEAMCYALDLAEHYFTMLDPNDPDYEGNKEFFPESAHEAIKMHFPEREMELIGAASAIGKNKLVEAMEKALSIPLLQDLPDSRTKVLSLIIKGKTEPEEFQHFHQSLQMILEKVSDKKISTSSRFIKDETRGNEVRIMVYA